MPLARPLRRLRARLRRVLRGRPIDLYYSPDYEIAFSGTPIDPKRGEKILTYLLSEALLPRRALHRPETVSMRALRRVHTDDYLASLRQPSALLPIVGYEPDDARAERALAVQRQAVGGTVAATRRALARRQTAVNLSGGFHHAEADAGRGFCIFNDVAVAVAAVRAAGFTGRVLVVDLDLHDGNGTRRIFSRDSEVFTFSIHNRSWDELPAAASLAIELGDGVEDETYLAAIRSHLPRVVAAHRADLVFYLAGTDPAAGDDIGDWQIGEAAMLERDRLVFGELERAGRPPLVYLLAGGYGRESWRASARSLAWLLSGRDDYEVPTSSALSLARLRELVRFVEAERFREDAASGDADWGITADDVYGSLGEINRRTRLLDYFSRHSIELVLERAGLLERLRLAGFARPTVELDLDPASGQTMRVFGDPERRDLLIELRLARDRRTLEGCELLRLEWLLIQNPRAEFHADRPPLPGQSHPGAGLLNEMMALVVLLAERLQLDGVLFVPSFYHLAATARRYLRFLRPEDEGWFRAVSDAVAGLSLAEATRRVRDGGVVTATGAPVEWRPMPMLIPLGRRIERHLDAERYEAAAEREHRSRRFRLAEAPGQAKEER